MSENPRSGKGFSQKWAAIRVPEGMVFRVRPFFGYHRFLGSSLSHGCVSLTARFSLLDWFHQCGWMEFAFTCDHAHDDHDHKTEEKK